MELLKFAMYYGYPSSVQNLINFDDIIKIYEKYDIIIFGGYHNDPNLENIIRDLLSKYTFSVGLIDMKWSKDDIKEKINYWNSIGAYGIFLDNCGYDCSTRRSKQNNIIDYVHDLNMIAFVTSKNPNDVMEDHINLMYNPFGVNSSIKKADWYVYIGFQINDGQYEDIDEWKNKSKKLVKLKEKFDINIACIATNGLNNVINQSDADYSYLSAAIYDFDAWGYAEYMFSKDSDYLPYINRKKIYGTKFTTEIIENSNIITRGLNVGVLVDTNSHNASILLK